MELVIQNSLFETCKTVFSGSFTFSDKQAYMDADAIRVFWDTAPTTEDSSTVVIKSLNNTFKNVQKRFYKINSCRLLVDGDTAYDEQYLADVPGMSHVAQLRGGATCKIQNVDFRINLRNYVVVIYNEGVYSDDTEITNSKIKSINIDNSLYTNRVFHCVNSAVEPIEQKVIVNNVEVDNIKFCVLASAEYNKFFDIKNLTMYNAEGLIEYQHTNSKGYHITNSYVETYLTNGSSGDNVIKDSQSSTGSENGTYIKNTTIVDVVREAKTSNFPWTTDFRGSSVVLVNFNILQKYALASPYLSSLAASVTGGDIKALNCSAYNFYGKNRDSVVVQNCSFNNIDTAGAVSVIDEGNVSFVGVF
jgi:hypothetical protein